MLSLLACLGTADASTEGTAHLLPARTVAVDLGAGGTSPYELGVLVGLRVGVVRRLQIGTNLAHAALAMPDLHAKALLVSQPSHELSLSTGALWTSLDRAWWLPAFDPQVDEAIEAVDLFLLPFALTWTWEGSRAAIDLGTGWDQAWATGQPGTGALVVDAVVGVRRAWVAPAVRVELREQLTWGARSTVPLYAAGRASGTAEYQVQEGVIAGVRTAEWFPLPFGRTTSARTYLEWSPGPTSLRVGASTSALIREAGLPCAPYLLLSRELQP